MSEDAVTLREALIEAARPLWLDSRTLPELKALVAASRAREEAAAAGEDASRELPTSAAAAGP